MTTTITNSLRVTSPLNFTRPSRPSAAPRSSGDSVSLGNAGPPKEPDLRGPEQGKSKLALGLAAGALAIVGIGAVVGGLHAPQIVQEQQVAAPVTTRTIERNADPIAQDQWTRVKDLGTPRPQDNASAQEVRAKYQEVAEELLPEADLFQSQAREMQHTAKRLEWAGKELGNGTHQLAGTTITVELREEGITVEQQDGQTHRSVIRDGENLTVEESTPGQGSRRLEASEDSMSVTEGQTTRTLYLRSGILHPAGEFEVVTGTRSMQQTTRIDGTRIRRETHQMVSGYAGRESIAESETWSAPEASIQMYPAPSLEYTSSRVSQNLSLQSTTNTYRNVEIRQDGSTVVRHNDNLDGVGVESIEPGLTLAAPAPVVLQQ